MNPIPLSLPDGRVRAFCCGECLWVPALPIDDIDTSRDAATDCCVCYSCGTPEPGLGHRKCHWCEFLAAWELIGWAFAHGDDP